MRMNSYGGNFINPSNEELSHGSAGHKKVKHSKAEVGYPEYPDSVEGFVSARNSSVASVKKAQSKKNSRFN